MLPRGGGDWGLANCNSQTNWMAFIFTRFGMGAESDMILGNFVLISYVKRRWFEKDWYLYIDKERIRFYSDFNEV